MIGGSVSALMPLVARDLLHGGAQTYGIMLGAFGMGAVIGALNITEVRRRMSGEAAVRACAISMGGAIATVALSTSASPDGGRAGGCGRRVDAGGRAVQHRRAAVGAALGRRPLAGGFPGLDRRRHCDGQLGLGASHRRLPACETALLGFRRPDAASPLLGIWLRMPPVGARNEAATELLADPEVQLSLTGRSGPLVVEIEYRVAPDNARAFHNVMQDVQLSRQRNGAYGWSIARDIADPELWTERYHCPTWLDYLRQRNRATQSERALHQRAIDFHLGPDPIRVRRMLERPFGSVRWKEDTPDRAANEVLPVVATAAGSST